MLFRFLNNAALFSASQECYAKGDFFKLPIPFQQIYLVNDAEVLKHILVRNEDNYIKSHIYWQQLRKIIGKAMGSVEGAEWLSLRKLQNPYFTKTAVDKYLNGIFSAAEVFTNNLPQVFSPAKMVGVFNMEMIGKYIFGIENPTQLGTIGQYIVNGEELIAWRSKYPWRPYLSKFHRKHRIAKRSLAFLDRWTNELIKDKISSRLQYGLIYTLLQHGYSQQHIRNELIIHLGAGTETAAVAVTWALWLLCTHPKAMKKAQQEVDKVRGTIQENDLKQLVYLESVMKETMRLYPPSHAIVRDAVHKDKIGDISVKPKDIFYISVYGIHRNPKFWEQPEAFIPERFCASNEKKLTAYSYMPFGAGKHTCIGKYMAMPMMIAVLANLIKKYEIKLLNQGTVFPVSSSTLKPNQELLFHLKQSI